MNHQNLAHVLRPQNFDEVFGHAEQVGTLFRAICLNKTPRVILFSGTRGVGKTTLARLVARALNCLNLSKETTDGVKDLRVPCNLCEACVGFKNNPDIIEMDAASHTGVEDVRSIIDLCYYLPQQSRNKVIIIDEAHMLSKNAFNALLKTLEEPPLNCYFMLATTEETKIPQTISSRCFKVSLAPFSEWELANYLDNFCHSHNLQLDPSSKNLLVLQSAGSLRDLLSFLDQVMLLDNRDQSSIYHLFNNTVNFSYQNLYTNIREYNLSKIVEIFGHNFITSSKEFIKEFMELVNKKIIEDAKQNQLGSFSINIIIFKELTRMLDFLRYNNLTPLNLTVFFLQIAHRVQEELDTETSAEVQNEQDRHEYSKKPLQNTTPTPEENTNNCTGIDREIWQNLINSLQKSKDFLIIAQLNNLVEVSRCDAKMFCFSTDKQEIAKTICDKISPLFNGEVRFEVNNEFISKNKQRENIKKKLQNELKQTPQIREILQMHEKNIINVDLEE